MNGNQTQKEVITTETEVALNQGPRDADRVGSNPELRAQHRHTPGPWGLDNDARRERYEIGINADVGVRIVCSVEYGFDEPFESQQHANARLIASAPDLLALAMQYASECAGCDGRGFTLGDDGISGHGPDDVEPTRHACEDCADIREVIAKAEGRS